MLRPHYHILFSILHPSFRNVQTVNDGFFGKTAFFSEFLRFSLLPLFLVQFLWIPRTALVISLGL